MRILIVDDEAPARARMRRLLDGIEGCEIAGEAANGVEALTRVAALEPDVVLLDVRMPGMDGVETARHLAQLDMPPAVIFTTAYGEYALEAFDVHAVDYLLKPVRAERLDDALARASKPTRAQLHAVSESTRSPRSHIAASMRGTMQIVPVEDIVCFVAEQKYVCVKHAGGELLIEEPLRALEAEFRPRFVRIHRNALVALDSIESLETRDGGGASVVLRAGGGKLDVSRRHLPAVRKLLRGESP